MIIPNIWKKRLQTTNHTFNDRVQLECWWHSWCHYILCHLQMSGRQNYSLLAMDMAKVGWSPIGCEGLYLNAMCKNRISVSGWSSIGCEGFRTNLNIPSPLPTTLVFRSFCPQIISHLNLSYLFNLPPLIPGGYIKIVLCWHDIVNGCHNSSHNYMVGATPE